jgi:UDP-3-O-[3-hydroxymyristoyl] N-acetylglucosamine deacetylase
MGFTSQTTLAQRVEIAGIGVHSGKPASLVLHPADVNTGIVFLRTGLASGVDRLIPARHNLVSATELCTIIGDQSSGAVSTIEHVLAALAGLNVDNVLIEIDGPEVPIMDGSAAPFVEAIDRAGLRRQAAPRRYLRVLKPVRVQQGRAWAELHPHKSGFRLEVEIDFNTPVIGRQKTAIDLDPQSFRKELARARTFGFMCDVEKLWQAGFALGASLDNTVALGDEGVVNPEGTRWPDEFSRHKTLDAVGDLALAGAPILGLYRSYMGGHRLNFSVLEALFADRTAYAFVEEPRRETGHAEIGARAAAYAPQKY